MEPLGLGELLGEGEELTDCVEMLPPDGEEVLGEGDVEGDGDPEGDGEEVGDGEEEEHLPQDCWQKPAIQLWPHWPQAACWAQVKVLPGAVSVQLPEPPEVELATLWVLMVAVGATLTGLGLVLGLVLGLLLGLGDLLGVLGVVGTSSCMCGPGSVQACTAQAERAGAGCLAPGAAGHCRGCWQVMLW